MKKPFSEQVQDVVKAAVDRYGTAYKLAQVSGINKVNIGRWLAGTPPRTADVAPIIEMMDAHIVMPGEEALDYDFVEKVAAIAGAGSSLVTSGETVGTYAFRKDFLLREGISARQSVMLDVVGDSMEPLIHAGDTILVDRSQIDVIDGKTYLVAYGEELRVKHVFKSPTGLILHSENSRYPDISIAYSDIGSLCVIHGRVRWFGRVI